VIEIQPHVAIGATLDSKIPFSEVALNEVFKNAKDSLHEQITAKNAIIDSDNLPVIPGYEKIFFQLFHNLISNGLKFQEAGNVPYIAIHTTVEKGNLIQAKDASGDDRMLSTM
jgi:light-regulated signal transduction histidine kinase (bacteriophytochrome)